MRDRHDLAADDPEGLGYLKQGRPEEAIPFLEEAARLQPRRVLVQEHLEQARK